MFLVTVILFYYMYIHFVKMLHSIHNYCPSPFLSYIYLSLSLNFRASSFHKPMLGKEKKWDEALLYIVHLTHEYECAIARVYARL